jgi:peptidoglycan/xylan/chitin deacetylase (PgdA/CDA1 family)
MTRGGLGAGHEIGHHGYLLELLRDMTAAQEGALIDRGLDALEKVTGVRPDGFRAPLGELSFQTPALLADRRFTYDSSLMDLDRPYVPDVGDRYHPSGDRSPPEVSRPSAPVTRRMSLSERGERRCIRPTNPKVTASPIP